MWNSERGGDTPELRDRKNRRQEESIVEQRERGDTPEPRDRKIRRQEKSKVEQREKWRYSRAERQEDQKTGEEYCRTAREEEILQS